VTVDPDGLWCFCDAAIQFCLSIKILFKLPLRQTCGMVARLLKLAGLDWAVPDYTTLCRRQKTLTVQIPFRRADGPLNRLVPLGTSRRDALPGSGRRLQYTSLPHRHPRARPHSDHPDPKERAGVQRRLIGRTRPQRNPAPTRYDGRAFWTRWTGYHARGRIALMNRFNALGTAEIIRVA
jgi:hypothetical protein